MRMLFHLLVGFLLAFAALYVYLNYWDDIHYALFGIETDYTIYINEQSIRVTLADTKEERKRGLSGVPSLRDLEGKLFLFDESGLHGIWMKDMLFPIDIIWINDDLEIVDIANNVSPDTYPEVFGPREPARYVLEVKAFFADSYKLQIGDRVNFPPDLLPADVSERLIGE